MDLTPWHPLTPLPQGEAPRAAGEPAPREEPRGPPGEGGDGGAPAAGAVPGKRERIWGIPLE